MPLLHKTPTTRSYQIPFLVSPSSRFQMSPSDTKRDVEPYISWGQDGGKPPKSFTSGVYFNKPIMFPFKKNSLYFHFPRINLHLTFILLHCLSQSYWGCDNSLRCIAMATSHAEAVVYLPWKRSGTKLSCYRQCKQGIRWSKDRNTRRTRRKTPHTHPHHLTLQPGQQWLWLVLTV